MKKSKTFTERLQKEIKPQLALPRKKKDRDNLNKRLIASLFGERVEDDHLPIQIFSVKQKYLRDIFYKHYEISSSLQRIALAEKLISRTQKKISNVEYIRYVYENYLNEMYIFNLRLNSLLDFVISKCQKKGLSKEEVVVKEFKKTIKDNLSNMVKVRGDHVHVKRYENPKLEQLSSLELMSDSFEIIKHMRDSELRRFRKKIRKEIHDNHSILKEIIEYDTYKYLGALIFTKVKNAHKVQRKKCK